jgi:hypothetical protein
VKDNPKIQKGYRSRLWCCQDGGRKKKSKPSQNPDTKPRDNVGLQRFDCQSKLAVACMPGRYPGTRLVTIHIEHHEKHKPYFDVEMPPEAVDIVRDNLEWSTPVSITPRVQALYPNITGKQVHKAWTEMSEMLWKRDQLQLPSAEILLREFGDDVDIFDIPVPDGVQQLCSGMKKIAAKLKGKVVEIGIDATCAYGIYFAALLSVLTCLTKMTQTRPTSNSTAY